VVQGKAVELQSTSLLGTIFPCDPAVQGGVQMQGDFDLLIGSLCVLVIFNVAVLLVLFSVTRLSADERFLEILQCLVYFDRFADEMESSQYQAFAAAQVSRLLGWRRIFVPTVVIGWLIALQVALIWKIQRDTYYREPIQRRGGQG
jgi:hypothetical protein